MTRREPPGTHSPPMNREFQSDFCREVVEVLAFVTGIPSLGFVYFFLFTEVEYRAAQSRFAPPLRRLGDERSGWALSPQIAMTTLPIKSPEAAWPKASLASSKG